MRKPAHIAALAALGLGLTGARFAGADPLDPALSRLVVLSQCNNTAPNSPGAFGTIEDDPERREQIAETYRAMGMASRDGLCAPDNRAWARLVNQWGFALAPASAYSARTTGFGGFNVSLLASYTGIDDGEDYWKLGTQGERDSASGQAVTFGDPPSVIQQYSLNVRKNFGLGVEALANVGFVPGSSIINGGADIRLSLLEGFRTGVGGVFPDLAAGAGIRTITGTDQMQLTTVALDLRASKPFTIARSSVLTPTVGYQYVWIFGRSGLIDLTPATDPLGYCGFSGTNIPSPGAAEGQAFDGQAECRGGTPLDFNNNVVFDQANLERQRLLFGLNYRREVISGGVQFMTDLLPPAEAQTSDSDAALLEDCDADGENCESVARQWQLAVELGVAF